MTSLTLSLATVCVAYVYPMYATYKVLTAASRNGSTLNAYKWHAQSGKGKRGQAQEKPTELAELETLAMYWCVIAIVRVAEAWGEWSWKWCVSFLTQDPVLSPRQVCICPLACAAADTRRLAALYALRVAVPYRARERH